MTQCVIKPVRVQAMTLRGLGSYLHGARLEIRPLTLLCGTNGSGKSTWFRMIELLKQSFEDNRLPFSFTEDLACGQATFHDYTNAFVKEQQEHHHLLESPAQDLEFGPLGSIGLELVAEVDFDLDDVSDSPSPNLEHVPHDPESFARSLLWAGRCPQGTRFLVRMNDTTCGVMGTPTPRRVEFAVNDDLWIRFDETSDRGVFAARCSRAFWPGHDPHDRIELAVGSFELSSDGLPTEVRGPDGAEGFDLQEDFCTTAVIRIRQLLDVSLRGIYWLSAIRPIHREGYVDPAVIQDDQIIRRRYVGPEGEYSHALARRFAYNLFRQSDPPPTKGQIRYRYPLVLGVIETLRREAESSRAPALAKKLLEPLDAVTEERLRDVDRPRIRELIEISTRLLNRALARRDLYDSSLAEFLSQEARELLSRGLDALEEHELEKFNRLLIDAALPRLSRPYPELTFDTYYSVWLKKLLNTVPERCGHFDSSAHYSVDPSRPPSGYLETFSPDERARRFVNEDDERDLNIYSSPLFGTAGANAAPVNMSSGFHQITPMIVQAGLMRPNELFCIENPEVHLHPKLQLDVTEFLIRQAAIGKTVLLETHSDLVVRRVMRAILEEDIKQESVRICFSDVELESPVYKEHRYASSRLQAIEIDERGQIRNWPSGFMDDDIRESRRLLDVMYGTPEDDDRAD